jgi:hypothetical protein
MVVEKVVADSRFFPEELKTITNSYEDILYL